MNSLDLASLKFWEFWAEFGFIMVFVGCIGEGVEIAAKLFAQKWFKKHEHPLDIFSGICWLILVMGLGLEYWGTHRVTRLSDSENARLNTEAAGLKKDANDARLETAKLQVQMLEASNNIVKNDLRNWPISEMSAVAWFTVMGTNMSELTNLTSGRRARMTLFKNERQGLSLDDLEAGDGDVSGHVWIPTIGQIDRCIYRVELHSFNFFTAMGINPPLVRTIDDAHIVRVDLNFLPRNSEIANGRVILKVNGISKYFDVPRQNDTNSNMGWTSDFQTWFVATNGVRVPEKQFLYLHD